MRTKFRVDSGDFSEAGTFIGDVGTWSTTYIINLELYQTAAANNIPNDNCDIEEYEGLAEEYLDQLPESSNGITWNMGFQNEHYTYFSELATKIFDDRDRPILLYNEDALLEIIDETTYWPENSIGEKQHFVIYQHIFIHYKLH